MTENERIKLIKIEMVKHDDTQVTLAGKCGISKYTMNRWMTGKGTPPIRKLEKIAQVYNLPRDYFI